MISSQHKLSSPNAKFEPFHCLDDCLCLSFCCWVTTFYCGWNPAEKYHWVLYSIDIRVRKKRWVVVCLFEYWAINQSRFQFFKGIMAFRAPRETTVLFCFLVKRFCYPTKVFDETSVVKAKCNKGRLFCKSLWSHCNELVVICCNSFWAQFVS